ncbi:hypothetical protein AVEN_271140-1 [Araneus ventricosus]|uniref:Integrase zinc-binding domain-containing protein n=1 Tax=Araneus ventricosus TaxID=182803 RepID=A0A4Y2E3M9_ARAVE|nr:hypothetical protein AVEN_271140-1 [Araneus ventricosus]
MCLFRSQLTLSVKHEKALRDISLFIASVYVIPWLNCSAAVKASKQDLCFLKSLKSHERIDETVSGAALKKFIQHLWYLSEEMSVLSLFEEVVDVQVKLKIVANIDLVFFNTTSIINFEDLVIDYDEMACAQENDEMLRFLLWCDTGLKLKPMNLGTKVINSDLSAGDIRPYVPENVRISIFQALHGLSHPVSRTTLDLIRKRYVWKHMNKDIELWCKSCIQCQRSKVNRHTKSALGEYELSKARFSQVHLDIVGPLPPSKDFVYVLTCLDRFSRLPEAFPMPRFLRIQKTRAVAYNPKCNDAVERFHRSLKSAIKCHATERRTEVLPSVVLGIRNSLKEDIGATPAEMVYGCPLWLPGEFFTNASGKDFSPRLDFLQNLSLNSLIFFLTSLSKHSASRYTFVNKDLFDSSHIFLRVDGVRSLYNNHIKAHLKCKQAYILAQESSLPSSQIQFPVPETMTRIRSGRRVRFVTPYQAYVTSFRLEKKYMWRQLLLEPNYQPINLNPVVYGSFLSCCYADTPSGPLCNQTAQIHYCICTGTVEFYTTANFIWHAVM